jgi:hypothetical protein
MLLLNSQMLFLERVPNLSWLSSDIIKSNHIVSSLTFHFADEIMVEGNISVSDLFEG